MLHHQVEPPAQHGGALLRRAGFPVVHGQLRGVNGAPRFSCAYLRHAYQQFAIGGVVHGERGAVIRIHPGAANIRLGLQQGRVRQ